MRVGGFAKLFTKAHKTTDVQCAYSWAARNGLPICTIGSGSNIIWTDAGHKGLVLKNDIRGLQITSEEAESMVLDFGAGEVLDEVIERTVKLGLSGMECLSLIPGTCGGAIIQNSGAYGQEISQVLLSVKAYDTLLRKAIVLDKESCGFGYRSSVFKDSQRGRYVILSFTVRLRRGLMERPSYPALAALLDENDPPSPAYIRSTVIQIRRSKLPDPATIPNCGSFFTNPVLTREELEQIPHHLEIPHQVAADGRCRVPAAWLIEKCGLKGDYSRDLGFGTWKNQPLVIFAGRDSSCAKLLAYNGMVERAVRERFGIVLEREPVLMGG
ncbi:hypothetical protein Q7P37_005360 [Cladosporium fusiforme]